MIPSTLIPFEAWKALNTPVVNGPNFPSTTRFEPGTQVLRAV